MFDFLPKRYVLALIGFSATTLSIALQTNVSIAIVYMVGSNGDKKKNVDVSECGIPRNSSGGTEIVSYDTSTKLDWPPDLQELVISIQFFFMIIGFIPGGRLAEVYGAKRTMTATLFVASLATALSPIAAEFSVYAFMACRVFVGLGSAPVFPALILLISRWIPDSEQSSASSFMLAGYGMGAFVSDIVGGSLCASKVFGGWSSIFYFSAVWGFLWCFWCLCVVYDFPEEHPTISDQEKTYIITNITLVIKKLASVPWKSILTSVPVWSLAIGTFGQYWLLAFTVTSLTVYMGSILSLESDQNGLLSSIPNLLRGVLACVAGCIIDCVRRRKKVPIVYVRKGATVLNTVISCLGFVGVLYSGCNPLLNMCFFIMATALGDFSTFGVAMVPNDIAPNIGGTLSGILSCVSSTPYVLLPTLIGYFTKNEQSMAQWRYVYYCTIAVTLVTTVIYVIFGTSDPQEWAIAEEDKANESDDINKNEQFEKGAYKARSFSITSINFRVI